MRSQKSFPLLLGGFVLLVSLIMDALAKKNDQSAYKTTYACEGRILNIVCDEGVIHLIRANFGRFSISICNDHGNLDWRVNCMSYHSFPIMQERCSLKPNCSVNVSSTTFHDPCPGTRKYLEVQYHCGSDNWDALIIQKPLLTTVISSSPPTVKSVAGASNTSVEEKSPLFTPPSSTKNTTYSIKSSAPHSTSKSTYIQQPPPPSTIRALVDKVTAIPVNPTMAPTTRKSVETPLEVITTSTKPSTTARTVIYTTDLYCASVLARGINWTWTKAGETAVLKCPEGASGFADWHCNLNPVQWTPESPNLNHCRSLWLDNIKRRMDHGDSIISVTTELALMSLAKQLYSEDLKDIGKLIQQALYKGVSSMENVLDMRHRYNVLRELLQSLVQTLSNLIDTKQKSAWNDLTVSERKILISAFLEALKESALLLAETSGHDGSFGLVKNNVLLSLKVFGLKEDNIQFPVFEDIDSDLSGIHWTGMQDKLILPAQSLQAYSRHGTVKVIFAAYKNINDFMEPGLDILHYSRNQVDDNKTRIVNSKIIAASLLTTLRTENPRIYPPVLITLKHVNEENATNPICVFWDFDLRDWSAEGCWVELSNKTHTVCACDHLTNFAVVMELKDAKSFDPELEILHIIISSGCVVAVVCLLITVTILSLLKITGDSIIIQKNMFFCLLVSETVFVAGIDQTKYHIACAVVAGVLQYFFLAAFSWMFFECYQQYTTFIGSSDPEKSHARFYYAVAYILPAIIVVISAIIDPTGYGTKQYCWLHLDNYFVFSFVGPAVAIVFGGIVFLSITVCIFCHHTSIATAIKGKEEAKLVNIKSLSRRTVMLIILVSFTWTSGLLYINKESVFLAYSFSTLNCILGTSILAFYCLRNERVKQEYKEILMNCHIFSSCLKSKNKEEESQSRVTPGPNRTATTDHISQQVWNMAREKNPTQVKCTTQGHLTTMVVKNPDSDTAVDKLKTDEKIINEPWEHATYSQWKVSNPRSGETPGQEENAVSNPSVEYHISGFHHHHSHYRQFLGGMESNSQFVDHIYETIDDDDDDDDDDEGLSAHESSKKSHIPQQQFPPAENYYGDHSDLSQHSSSSYGYDQRPLLIMGGPTRHMNTLQTHMPSEDYNCSQSSKKKLYVSGEKYDCQDNNSCFRDKINLDMPISKQSPCNITSNNTLPGKHSNLTKTFNPDVKGPSLPDLLQCPADSSVVFAVLEGDKVVSQLQQDDVQTQQPPKYKLSTYC